MTPAALHLKKKKKGQGRKKKVTAQLLYAERLTMYDGMTNDKRGRERKNEKKRARKSLAYPLL